MKRLTTLKASLCAFCLLVVLSCSENRIIAEQNQELLNAKETFRVQDGVLHFSSKEEFDRVWQSILNKSNQFLDNWEKELPNFTSMRKAYTSITEADILKITSTKSIQGYENYLILIEVGGEIEATCMIDNEALATLFNKDGLVVIGAKAYKYKFNSIVEVKSANKDVLVELSKPNPSMPKTIIKEFVLERKTNGEIINDIANGKLSKILNDHCIHQYSSNGTKRVVGESNSNKTLDGSWFTYLQCQAKHQRRIAGIWWADDIPKIELYMSSALTNGGQNISVPLKVDADNNNNVQYTICFGGYNCAYGTIAYTGRGLCDDNQWRECSESESTW